MNTQQTLPNLIDTFVKQTQSWANELEDGNAKKANKFFDKIKVLASEIRQNGELGQKALFDLTSHKNRGVRYWSAMYSIRYDSPKALSVLKDLNESKGAVSMSAYTALYLYESGEMEVP